MLNPQNTYIALLVVQALHLLHHRLAKRHLSIAEVISAVAALHPALGTGSGVVADRCTSSTDYGSSS